jgi:hypothetical protein
MPQINPNLSRLNTGTLEPMSKPRIGFFLCVGCLLFAQVKAQYTTQTRLLAQDSDAATYIQASTKTIVYVAPYIKSQPVAQALGDAVIKRGVKVYLLLERSHITDKDAYSDYLAMLQNHPIYKKYIAVRTTPINLSYVALLDSRTILRGSRIASPTTPYDQNIGLVSFQSGDIKKFNQYFGAAWRLATTYQPKLNVPYKPK